MKSKLIIAGLVIIMTMMLTPLSFVGATDQTPPLTVAASNGVDGPNAIVWTVDFLLPSQSGKNVIESSIICYWYNSDGSGGQIEGRITPYKISYTDSQMKLWFDPSTIPEHVDNNAIKGSFSPDGSFWFTGGPGWTWGRR